MAASEPSESAHPILPRLTRRPTETSRVRELYKYYQPPSAADTGAPGSAKTLFVPSDDPSLAAYAQLAALRLDCERSLISLIDRSSQYIIADATRIAASQDLHNGSWLEDQQSLSSVGALCQHTIKTKAGNAAPGVSRDRRHNRAEGLPLYEVSDLSLDDKWAQSPIVTDKPHFRFFCGVPLCTERGHFIGVLCVIDPKPRMLDEAETGLIRWMADTVMKHLELKAEKNLKNFQRMQNSLSSFVAGGWAASKSSGGARTPRNFQSLENDRTAMSPADMDRDNIGGLNRRITGAKRKILLRASSKASVAGADREKVSNNAPVAGTNSSHTVQAMPSPVTNLKRPELSERNSSSSTTSTLSKVASSFTSVDSTSTSLTNVKSESLETIPEPTFRNTFTRASILIQQAIDVDCVVFVDAETYWDGGIPLPTPMSSDSDENKLQQQSLRHTRSGSSTTVSRAWSTPTSVLGFSTGDTSSPFELHGDSRSGAAPPPEVELDPNVIGPLKQEFLHELFERYPRGKMLILTDSDEVFTSDDEVEEETDDDNESTEGERTSSNRLEFKRKIVRSELSAFLPGSASCVFVPLYDDFVGRPFAALFASTKKLTRIFSKDEMGFLLAFANSILAEVSRLHIMSADRAKGDFISNISHELRSPLHGILASSELLVDTTLDTFQGSLVETVESCGRTLLDTINHVLDFSKLNTLENEGKARNPGSASQEEQTNQTAGMPTTGKVIDGGALNLVSQTNIASVIEEVVEGVYAGSVRSAITVIIDIDPRDNWVFETQPGAIRRIIMNIFGNALKYTEAGFVKVRLQAEDFIEQDYETQRPSEKTLVTLTVADSGKGISREFLKTKLFTPFAQENSLVTGTGLGLSIVRKIVEILRGTIEVKSEVGLGTEVKVFLVFDRQITIENDPKSLRHKRSQSTTSSISSTVLEEADEVDLAQQVKRAAIGKKIVLLGFEASESDDERSHQAMKQLRQSLERCAHEWFGMTVVPPTTGASLLDYHNVVDVVLANEAPSLMTQLNFKGPKPPMIILCANAARYGMYSSQADHGSTIDFASKPCGPKKLAKALSFIQLIEASRRSSTHSSQSGTSVSRPSMERNQTSPSIAHPSSLTAESILPASAVRFSPPVRSGSSESEPVVYVPGRGMMSSAGGSSAIPYSSARRRSIPFFEDLQQQQMKDRESNYSQDDSKSTSSTFDEDGSSRPRKKSATPHLGSFVALNPPNLGDPHMSIVDGHIANRPAMASPVAEKENPLRPKSWGQWQSLDAPVAATHVAGLDGMLQPSMTPSMKAALEAGERAELRRLLESSSGIPPIANGSNVSQKGESSLPSILIVEDNAINMSLLATFLAKRGYPFVEQAENGSIAVEKVTCRPVGFDIIIMDLQMPVMSGIEATRAIRKHEDEQGKNQQALIIALTGLAAVNDQKEAFASGADMFLSKPVSFKLLQKELEKWYIDNRRAKLRSASSK